MILSTMIEINLFEALGWTLIHSLWQITAIAILLALVKNHLLLKKSEARYFAGVISMFLIFLLSIGTFLYYFLNNTNFDYQGQEVLTSFLSNSSKQYQSNILGSIYLWLNNHIVFITMTWVLGFLFFALKNAGALVYLAHLQKKSEQLSDQSIISLFQKLLKRSKIEFGVELKVSNKISGPLTFGVFKSIILLPLAQINHLSLEETEAILAHEIAHIIRKDFIINLFLTFVGTLFYFHPGIWWINRYIELEREKSTDAFAMRIAKRKALDYAKLLYNVQQLTLQTKAYSSMYQKQSSLLSMPLIKKKKHLLSRIENILGKQEKRNPFNTGILLMISTLIYLSLISLTDISLPGRQSHPALAYESQKHFEEENNLLKAKKDTLNLTLSTLSEEEEKSDDFTTQIKVELSSENMENEEEGKLEVRIIQKIESKENNEEEINFIELEDELINLNELSLKNFEFHDTEIHEFEILLDLDQHIEHIYTEDGPNKFFSFKQFPTEHLKTIELKEAKLRQFLMKQKHLLPTKADLDSSVVRIVKKINRFDKFSGNWYEEHNRNIDVLPFHEHLEDNHFFKKRVKDFDNENDLVEFETITHKTIKEVNENKAIEKIFIFQSSDPTEMHVLSEIIIN